MASIYDPEALWINQCGGLKNRIKYSSFGNNFAEKQRDRGGEGKSQADRERKMRKGGGRE